MEITTQDIQQLCRESEAIDQRLRAIVAERRVRELEAEVEALRAQKEER
jgi:hypothetical protein